MKRVKANESALRVLHILELVLHIMKFSKFLDQVRLISTCSAVFALRGGCSLVIDHAAMRQFELDYWRAFRGLKPSIPASVLGSTGGWTTLVKLFNKGKHPLSLTYTRPRRTRLAARQFCQPTTCPKMFVLVNDSFRLKVQLDQTKNLLRLMRPVPIGLPYDSMKLIPVDERCRSAHNVMTYHKNALNSWKFLIYMTHLNGIPMSQFKGLAAVELYMKQQQTCAIGLFYFDPLDPAAHQALIPDQCFLQRGDEPHFKKHDYVVSAI